MREDLFAPQNHSGINLFIGSGFFSKAVSVFNVFSMLSFHAPGARLTVGPPGPFSVDKWLFDCVSTPTSHPRAGARKLVQGAQDRPVTHQKSRLSLVPSKSEQRPRWPGRLTCT